MPARLIVTLRPKVLHDHGAPPHTGPAVHAAVLAAIRSIDPELSARAHAAGTQKPLACTPLLGERQFEVGVLDDGLTGTVARALKETAEVRLGHSSFFLDRVDVHTHSWDCLLDRAEPARSWTVRFLTPTTFRTVRGNGARRSQPFPSVEFVFGALVRRWERFGSRPLPDGTVALVERHVAVEEHDISTRRHLVKAPDIYEVGFVGMVRYTTVAARDADAQARRGVGALLLLAMLSGVGDHTAKGMGCARLVSTVDD